MPRLRPTAVHTDRPNANHCQASTLNRAIEIPDVEHEPVEVAVELHPILCVREGVWPGEPQRLDFWYHLDIDWPFKLKDIASVCPEHPPAAIYKVDPASDVYGPPARHISRRAPIVVEWDVPVPGEREVPNPVVVKDCSRHPGDDRISESGYSSKCLRSGPRVKVGIYNDFTTRKACRIEVCL